MCCDLLTLPAELQLKIIDEQLRDDRIVPQANGSKKNPDEPTKIHEELINWSSTCSYFRNLLVPYIFKSAKLLNNEKSASSLNALVQSPHHVHVKELRFIGFAVCRSAWNLEPAELLDMEENFPGSVQALLSNLARFPNLEKLRIRFYYDLHLRWPFRDFDITEEVDTPKQVVAVAWRALMSNTYSALAQNQSCHFKHLEIRVPKWSTIPAFCHTAFHDFLSLFDQFTLSLSNVEFIPSWYTPMECMSNTNRAIVGNLDKHFFNHLAQVTSFTFKAPEWGPLGLKGGDHIHLALKAGQMPMLRTLYLEHIFAGPELIDFLVAHKDTLEDLTLRDCYASPPDTLAENGINWSQFFTSLSSASPTQLRRFEISGRNMRFLSSKCDNMENKMVGAIQRCHTAAPSGRMLFQYAEFSISKLCIDSDVEDMEFLKGEDRASFDRLMELVEENAKRGRECEESAESRGRGVKRLLQSQPWEITVD